MDRSTLLLSSADVAGCLRLDEAIVAVDDAFRAFHRHEAVMPPKSYVSLPDHDGDVRSMPARVGNAVSVKWVCSHPKNPERFGLPTVLGTLILTDPATGFPLSIMDATLLTAFRTGAAAAVATDALARADASSLGIVGCGTQARFQIAAISRVRDIKRIVLSDSRMATAEALAASVRAIAPGVDVRVGSIEEAAGQDIVCTLTPVYKPIIRAEWIKRGAHINALGADAAGKQEIDSDALANAVVVVDDWDQALHSGEVNVPMKNGTMRREHIRGTLGAILEKVIPGRSSDREITVFDSTGLAIQDAAVARVVYDRAVKSGCGTAVRIMPEPGAKLPDVLEQMRRSV